jgi:hypothetical protein
LGDSDVVVLPLTTLHAFSHQTIQRRHCHRLIASSAIPSRTARAHTRFRIASTVTRAVQRAHGASRSNLQLKLRHRRVSIHSSHIRSS